MKFPMILTVIAAALGSTASFATTAPAMLGAHIAGAVQNAPEMAAPSVEHEAINVGWFRLISNDDEDDDEGEDDCEDDDHCTKGAGAAPNGPSTPPSNGLFSTGKAPVVKSN
jgi:hypothetical protein